METTVDTQVHLLDLPKDILRDIAQSADKTTQCIMHITCKYLQEVVPPVVGPIANLAAHDGHL